ncbi:MAG: hypothetical protein EOM59_06520 [Clostridia bacterium]|nr:hypothetical protein [Clostridia bacterium]
MKKIKQLIKERDGTAVPLAAAIALSLVLIFCGISEYLRVFILVQEVRDAVQQAVICVVNDNYDDAYHSIREGYAAGFVPDNGEWEESLDSGDVASNLAKTLDLKRKGGSYVKYAGEDTVFTVSDLVVTLKNAPIRSDGNEEFLAESSVLLEIPLRFGTEILPPVQVELEAQAEWIPIF